MICTTSRFAMRFHLVERGGRKSTTIVNFPEIRLSAYSGEPIPEECEVPR